MKKGIYSLFLLLLLITMVGCKEESSEEQAQDYMPFTTSSGALLHWGSGAVIKIYLPSDASASGITGYQSGYNAAVKAGIAKWDVTLANMGVTYDFTGTLGNNDLKIEWDDGTGVETGVLGFATINSQANPSRKILMTTRENYTTGNPSHSAAAVTAITGHELGHMLGIWSHSFDTADLMYPFLTTIAVPSSRDKATMQYLYGITPDLNLDQLDPNSALTAESSQQGEDSGFFFKINCGPNRELYGYPETESYVPPGMSLLRPELR